MDRAKPAVPFGGTYRLIDFVLSNLVNAGMRQIAVLTQYKSHSLDRHISLTWRMSTLLGNYVTPVPAQQRLGPRWYQGSADAIFQSMNLINDEDPDYVVVFGADNIYRMDVSQMLDAHIDGGLGCTVAGIRVPRSQASAFGVIDAGDGQQDRGVPGEAGRPARAGRRPGVVVRLDGQLHLHQRRVDRRAEQRRGERRLPARHGRGHHPELRRTRARPRCTTSPPTRCPAAPTGTGPTGVTSGTIDAYHEAHMDLVSVDPVFNLYNLDWPIWTYPVQMPGAKFTLDGQSTDSIVSPGCIVSGGSIDDSVLSPNVRVRENARIDQSVLLSNVWIGRGRDHPPGDPGQERRRRGRRARSASTPRPTGPAATPSPTAASPSVGKGVTSTSQL